ncbi:hypothetical protein [Bacteroides zoogleoformans]|uniref:hypothetical protein n=1 Tax=Bacteroides zoogleoformans TaxID=28119 RepID=UPI00248DA114|nr:hypothetical protein [Bacteroides zoogleoformans]
MKLYLFNPDADMALGNNEENYMAPAAICRMAEDLALLPVWYAEPGSAVLAPSAYNTDFLKQVEEMFRPDVKLLTLPELAICKDVQVMPWGWNPAICKRLLKAGVPACRLPVAEQLAAYRRLSSRERAMEVLKHFMSLQPEGCCGESHRLATTADCREFVLKHDACVLKMPWSGSGKGLNWCKSIFTKSIEGWCERIIREQGFVSGEPLYHRVEDFAMEFCSDGCGKVSFVGYSLFLTNKSGAYSGNLLMASPEIEKRMAGYVSGQLLHDVRNRLCKILSEQYGATYQGYLGVDMMVCLLQDGRYAVHPCVEVNMRMNMGVFSLLFHEYFMASERTGLFTIEYFLSNEALRKQHEQDRLQHPVVVKDGKLVSGYLPLVPVTARSSYRAYVQVD